MSFARNEEQLTEEKMKEKIDLLQQIAFEKCRKHRTAFFSTTTTFYNHSERECTAASKKAVEAMEDLYRMKFGSK